MAAVMHINRNTRVVVWGAIIAIGFALLALDSAWLPYLLVAAMLLMHLGMPGHHGQGHSHGPEHPEAPRSVSTDSTDDERANNRS